jgi:enolase
MRHSIAKVTGREVLDSRGNPTIEVEIETEAGICGSAIVPSGASTGIYEAFELRDGGSRYHGKGVLRAISSVNKIASNIMGIDVREQDQIDQLLIKLDSTENKSNLGSNAILGISLACAKAAASSEGLHLYEYVGKHRGNLLPAPFFNIINGGKHAGNHLDFQEFMIVPLGAENFREALMIGSEIYHTLKKQLEELHGSYAINVGDEGGFVPPIDLPEEALEAAWNAVEASGYSNEVSLAMDVAASSFYSENCYLISGKKYTTGELIDFYEELVDSYKIVSIEDPLEEEDFDGFSEITRKLPIQIVGDDIFVTNVKKLRKGIEIGAGNALLWKVNQVGTLTEAIETAELAINNNYGVMASHRSGDTEDTFVADFAVGLNFGQIKAGAPARGERTSKYNRLLRIEEWLGKRAKYPKNLSS